MLRSLVWCGVVSGLSARPRECSERAGTGNSDLTLLPEIYHNGSFSSYVDAISLPTNIV